MSLQKDGGRECVGFGGMGGMGTGSCFRHGVGEAEAEAAASVAQAARGSVRTPGRSQRA